MANLTSQDLYDKIEEIIKVSPAATDTTKLQGKRHRELLQMFADAIFQQQSATAISFPWNIPITSAPFNGQSFDTTDLVTGLYQLLHPATPPRANLSAVNAIREVGSATSVTLNYSFNQGSGAIATVFVNGVKVPNSPMSGTQAATTAPDTATSYNMAVTDTNGLSATSTTQVRYLTRFFIFSSPQKLGLASDSDLSNVLKGLNGNLVDSRNQSAQLTPNGEYYYVAYDNSLGINPIIKVNGFQDTSVIPHSFTYNNSQGADRQYTIFCGENLITGLYNFEVS